MGLFNRKKKEFANCGEGCEEIERRGCDECLIQLQCEEVYKNTDHTECWQCRYKDCQKNKCTLCYRES